MPSHNLSTFEAALYDAPYGAIVATAQLIDCREMCALLVRDARPTERACGDWRVGRYAWVLGDVVPLEDPIAVRGRQGLWDWDGSA